MRISRDLLYIKAPIIFTLMLLPFWEVIASQFLNFSETIYSLVSIAKYFPIIIAIIYCAGQYLWGERIRLSKSLIPLFLYFIVLTLHVVGDGSIILILDAIKLQVFFVLFCFFIGMAMDRNQAIAPSVNLMNKIFLAQLILAVSVGVFEFFDQSILMSLYGKALEDMSHVTWMSSVRLISLLGNPINLGAFIVICMSFQVHGFFEKKPIKQIALLALMFFSLFVVIFTLSRLALICFIALFFLIFIFLLLRKNYLSIIMILLPIIWVVFHFDLSNIDFGVLADRFGNMLDDNEYSGNLRVYHWLIALQKIDNPFFYLWGLGLGKSNPAEEMVLMHEALLIENSFLTVFVETGFIGLVLYLWCVSRSLKLSWLYFKNNGNPAFLIFYIIFIIFSFGNDFNRNMPFSFYFWFFYVWLDWHNKFRSRDLIKST